MRLRLLVLILLAVGLFAAIRHIDLRVERFTIPSGSGHTITTLTGIDPEKFGERIVEAWRAWHGGANNPLPLLLTYAALDLVFVATYVASFVTAGQILRCSSIKRGTDVPSGQRRSFSALLRTGVAAEAVEMTVQLSMGRGQEPLRLLGHILGWAALVKWAAVILAGVLLVKWMWNWWRA